MRVSRGHQMSVPDGDIQDVGRVVAGVEALVRLGRREFPRMDAGTISLVHANFVQSVARRLQLQDVPDIVNYGDPPPQ